MNRKALDDDDHVSRYCSPRTIENGMPTGVAFLPRTTDDYLSVNWLEYFNEPSFASAIAKIRDVFAQRVFASNQMGSLLLSMYEKQNLLDLTRIGICESSVDQNRQ